MGISQLVVQNGSRSGQRSREQPSREHGHLRRRTGQDNVRGGGTGIRKTILCSPAQIPKSAPTRLQRCVHPVACVEPSRKREALLVRDAHALRGHISQGRRTGERGQGRESEDGYPSGTSKVFPILGLSPWFSAEVTQEVLPWVYVNGGKPSLVISTLEALAVLVSLKMFYGEQPAIGKQKVTVAPAWTDQPRDRICTQQINDLNVPSVRGADGVVGVYEAHVHEGCCRVDPPELGIERQIK